MKANTITGYIASHGLEPQTEIVIATQDGFASQIGYLSVETDMQTGLTVIVAHPHYAEQLDTEAHPAFVGEPK